MGSQRVRIGNTLVNYTDAKRDVMVERGMIDIWKGNPGVSGECMNSQCIVRNADLFPHKVFLVSVTKSRVYIVDRIDGRSGKMLRAVRYILSGKDGADIAQHDVLKSAIPATLTLHAPKGSKVKGNVALQGPSHAPSRNSTPKGLPVSRGEQARLLAAVGAMRH